MTLSRKTIAQKLGETQHLKNAYQDARDFVTDKWPDFFRCLAENRRFYGKDLTFSIEVTNSDIRQRNLKEEQKLRPKVIGCLKHI